MKLTKNFNSEEFASGDGSETPCEVLVNLKELALNLQRLRDWFQLPIHINSGYRSPEWNAKVGGVANSQHLYGKAADIWIETVSPEKIKMAIESLIAQDKMKQGGVGLYDTFVHYDIRGTAARWDFRK